MNQADVLATNRTAWTASSYDAWVSRYGAPAEAAADIVSDPERPLRRLLGLVGDPRGLRVANPLGSHGRVAVALALLGADVTVFDLSESNARYARELAVEANVDLNYVVGDLQVTAPRHPDRFDTVVMDLGIVHYFVDIERFVESLQTLLAPGGKLVLSEFHPLLKKSLDIDSSKPVFRGDYFRTDVEEARTPYEVFVNDEVPTCLVRRWTLGEIVTAFASGGFRVQHLIEYPSATFSELPGTFTLVAKSD